MLIKRDFLYTPKGKNRPLHIWLPEDYDSSGEWYPVMYFFDGHNLFFDADATYGKSWGLKDFLEGWGKRIIVVGIECGHEGQERLSEYLPYPANKDSWFSAFAPMGDATMAWIVNEIKPFIDREYRTIPFRECTGIGGSSMGGLMALYGAVRYNRWFSKAACVSSAIGFCMRPLMSDMRRNAMSPDTRIFLSWGTKEAWGKKNPNTDDRSSKTYGFNKRVADQAASAGAAVKLCCQIGGGHCEADWEKQVPEFMDFLWLR
ncbi:MAG: alpha/beta hydrolase [Oscillospiraceae bacterium]|nr:alpha/beta hydrolase [Oscillospiraceae bacterium]